MFVMGTNYRTLSARSIAQVLVEFDMPADTYF